MKKSEMQRKIAKFLGEYFGEEIPNTYGYLAIKLLNNIQEEGMLPPVISGYKYWAEWEDENEVS